MRQMQKMLIQKEMRASFWEQYRKVPETEMIEREMDEGEHMMIGDMFTWKKNGKGDFLIMGNGPVSI